MSTTVRSSPLALTVLGMLHTQPLHPYGIQRLIKQWGKDQVVNVGQRASLYRTIDRLHAAGLVSVLETERDHQYPERTVYAITAAGRAATREWLEEMLAVPKQDFPEFPAALSHVVMLTAQETLALLERREILLTAVHQGLEAGLASTAGDLAGGGVRPGHGHRPARLGTVGNRRPANRPALLDGGGAQGTARGRQRPAGGGAGSHE